MQKILFFLLFMILFSGCTYTTYDYIAPNSNKGFQCVNNCSYDKKQCEDRKRIEQLKLDRYYNYSLEIYKECKRKQDPKHIKKRCEKYIFKCMKYNNKKVCEEQCLKRERSRGKCYQPRREFVIGHYCNSNYDQCFKGCGGEIIPVKKKVF